MKAIRIFFWVTAVITTIGVIDMIGTGDFDVYTLWSLVAYWLAVYYAEENK